MHPARKLVRLVEAEGGARVTMRMRVSARPSYARKAASWQRRHDDGFAIEAAAFFSNVPVEASGDDLLGNFLIAPKEPVYAVLDYSDDPHLPDLVAIRGGYE